MRLKTVTCMISLAALTALAPVGAQQQSTQTSQTSPQTKTRGGSAGQSRRSGRSEHEPCWKRLGIPESVHTQRRTIQENTRAQLEKVCTDSSLTDQQKREKIREIHKSAHQQIEALLTPQQREQLRECQGQHEHHMEGRSEGEHGSGQSAHKNPCEQIHHGSRGR